MRLSKHTPEEIKAAKGMSFAETPTDEQIAKWKEVHERLCHKIKVETADSGYGINITNIDPVIWPMLGDAGRKVAQCKGSTTVLEMLKNNRTGKIFPWYKSFLTGYEHITEEALDGLDYDRVCMICLFLAKLIEVDKGDTSKIEYWVKRFAALFNQLAYYNKIEYGILSSFTALPLADIEAEKRVREYTSKAVGLGKAWTEKEVAEEVNKIRKKAMDEAKTMRILLMVYPYSRFEKDELNKWLGNPAFVDEGGIGTSDWSGLPDV